MNTGLAILKNLEKVKKAKIDITALTRDSFDTPELRAKYFRANNIGLDRLHLPILTAEDYEEIAETHFTNKRMHPANLRYDTATAYYHKKARLQALANDLGVAVSKLDSTDYIWDENWYIHPNILVNMVICEDIYRTKSSDEREMSANTAYIGREPKNSAVDIELWNELYNLCYKAIITRKAMLLTKIPQCLSFLISVLEYTNGFSDNCTGVHNATLKSYQTFFTELLKDKEGFEFIKSTNDVKVFASNEFTHKDYVETYRSMLRRLSRCSGEELEYYREDLSLVEDPYIDEILEKEITSEDLLSEKYLVK